MEAASTHLPQSPRTARVSIFRLHGGSAGPPGGRAPPPGGRPPPPGGRAPPAGGGERPSGGSV